MSARRYGGRFSPGGETAKESAPPAFRNRRARRVSVRARLMYVLPVPLFFAGLGAAGRGGGIEMLVELGGFGALIGSAWLLNEGIRAADSYAARAVANPPAIPRKLFAAMLSALTVAGVGLLSLDQGLFGALSFGAVAGLAQLTAFGLDPMRKKGVEGADARLSERIARAIEQAEQLVRDTAAAAERIGDRGLEARVERLCGQARDMFRTVETDPRDLTRARRFLSVYLLGLRDATVKFADLRGRGRDPVALENYQALLSDLETSFVALRTDLLSDNRSDLDVEIEVLRERLHHDGLTTR